MLATLLLVGLAIFLLLLGLSGVFGAERIVEAQHENDIAPYGTMPIDDETRLTMVQGAGVLMLAGAVAILVSLFL